MRRKSINGILLTLALALGTFWAVGVRAQFNGCPAGLCGGPAPSSGCSQATTLLGRMDGSENTSAVRTLVCSMVSDGTWSLLDFLHVFAINSTTNAQLGLYVIFVDAARHCHVFCEQWLYRRRLNRLFHQRLPTIDRLRQHDA
jgi:hypothetical protein